MQATKNRRTREFRATSSTIGWDAPHLNSILSNHVQDPLPLESSNPWILCIDDDQQFSDGLKLSLQSRGYEVVRAFEGINGYRYAFEFGPHAILLDLNLPNKSGEEILRQLKMHESTANIPVLIVTGVYDDALEPQMLALGARDFFRKPVSFSVLSDAVDWYSSEGNLETDLS